MNLPKRGRTVCAGLVAVGILLSACGAETDTPAATTPAREAVTGASTSVPRSTGPATSSAKQSAVLFTSEWTDSDGYSYRAVINEPTTSVDKDIANSKPGEAQLEWTIEASGTLENTTPNRNAPFPEDFSIQPTWSAGSELCTVDTTGRDKGFSSNIPANESDWCTLTNMPLFFHTEASERNGGIGFEDPIPAGTTLDIQLENSNVAAFIVPEAEADTTISSVEAPTLYTLGRSDVPSMHGQNKAQCLLMTQVWVFAETQETGCETEQSP
jgi:hypothetical protein